MGSERGCREGVGKQTLQGLGTPERTSGPPLTVIDMGKTVGRVNRGKGLEFR